jgi:hypothetical protein
MKQNSRCAQLHELIDADLPADELERLGRVDALLRTVARADDRDQERSRECERARASISATLDGELSEHELIRMRAHVEDCASCRAFQADAETFAAALRAAAAKSPSAPLAVPTSNGGAFRSHKRRTPARPSLRLVTTPPATTGSTRQRTDKQTHELKLTFGELALIYKSLQAAKTLGALPPQDELLNDTIQLVDQALNRAI